MEKLNELKKSGLIWNAVNYNKDTNSSTSFKKLFLKGSVHEVYIKSLGNALNLHVPLALPLIICREQSREEDIKNKLFIFIGKECFPSPFFLQSAFSFYSEIYLSNFIFINASTPQEKIWAIETALSSTSVVCVFASTRTLTFSVSKRLSLLAKKNGALCFIFKKENDPSQASAAYCRWLMTPELSQSLSPQWKICLLHTKGSKLLEASWSLSLDYEKKVSLHVLPKLVNQPGSSAFAA